jgi:hypothetical protein
MPDSQDQSSKLKALKKILNRLPAQMTYYGSALGAIVLASGGQLPPGLEAVAGGIGMSVLSNLIDEIARGEDVLDDEIRQRTEEAITKSDIANLLTKQDFLQGYARLIQRLDAQKVISEHILDELRDGFDKVATAEQVEELKRLIIGKPSALSIVPLTRRPLLNNKLIGREEPLRWLQETPGDKLLAGEPGSGKTSLLYHFTQIQAALFAVSEDMGNISRAIREQKPRHIIVDDAHVAPEFLEKLNQLRAETDAEFEIIATCWIGDKHAIAEILNLSEIHIHTLKRLSRDQMVEVIAGAGIQGVNWLMREIVTQAEGLPGLAVYDDPRK